MRRECLPLERQRCRLSQLDHSLRAVCPPHQGADLVVRTRMGRQHRPQPQRTEVTRIEGQGQIKASCGLLEVAVKVRAAVPA